MADPGNILVGVDFSEHSRNAAREAWRIANDSGSRLHVAHIVTADTVEDHQQLYQLTVDEIIGKVSDQLDTFIKLALPDEAKSERHVLIGHPYHDLMGLREITRADLLVLGSRGTTTEKDHKTGMIATKCVRHSPVSVLLVREGHKEAFKKIVACIDFSDASEEAMHRAAKLAASEGAALHVLHVHYPPWLLPTHVLYNLETSNEAGYREEYRNLLAERMDAFVAPIRKEFSDLELHEKTVEHMTAAYGIMLYLTKLGADLAVVASQGHSGIRDIFIGSTAERIVQQSNCSVLTVRPLPT